MERSGFSANQILAVVKRAESDILVLGRGWGQVSSREIDLQVKSRFDRTDAPLIARFKQLGILWTVRALRWRMFSSSRYGAD